MCSFSFAKIVIFREIYLYITAFYSPYPKIRVLFNQNCKYLNINDIHFIIKKNKYFIENF